VVIVLKQPNVVKKLDGVYFAISTRFQLCEHAASLLRLVEDHHAARLCLAWRYSFLYSFASVSSPLLSGVHFGSSLNKRIALVYYTKTSAHSSPTTTLKRHSTYVLVIGSKPMIYATRQNN
jgi:hypothetical protein